MSKSKVKPWRSPHRKSPFRNWFKSAGENLKNMDPSMLAFGGAGVLMSAMFGGEDEDAGAQFQGNIDEHLQGFKDIDTGNLFAGAQNTFANLTNQFAHRDLHFLAQLKMH